MGTVIQHVRFAFRADGDTFFGGRGAYASKVIGDTLSVTPVQARGSGAASPLTLRTVSIGRGASRANSADVRALPLDDGSLTVARGEASEQIKNTPRGVEVSWTFAHEPKGSGDVTVRVRVSGEAFKSSTSGGLHFVDSAARIGVRYGHATWVDARGTRTEVAAEYAREAREIRLTVPAAVVAASAYPAVLDPTIGPETFPDGLVTISDPDAASLPSVASNGSSYLVAWLDSASGSVHSTLLDLTGALLSVGDALKEGMAQNPNGGTAVASDGADYLVAWSEAVATGVQARRVSSTGTPLGGGDFSIVASGAFHPKIAFDGTNFLVVWEDARGGASHDVYGQFVDKTGALVGSNFLVSISLAGPPPVRLAGAVLGSPSVAFDGVNYLVVWQLTSGNIYGQLVAPTGAYVGTSSPVVTSPPSCSGPSVAYNATDAEYLVACQAGVIYAQRVTTGGAPNGASVQVSSTNATSAPAVTSNGTGSLVVWQSNAVKRPIQGARFLGGALLDPGGFEISPKGGTTPGAVSVASSGSGYFSAWGDYYSASYSQIRGARVTSAKVVQDVPSLLVSATFGLPSRYYTAIAFDGTNYLLVWTDDRPGGNAQDIYAARVTPGGTVLEPAGLPVATALGQDIRPAVAFNGTNYLVAWYFFQNPGSVVHARLVSTSGNVVGTELSLGAGADPAVASDGKDFVVVAFDQFAGTRVWRVSAAGAADATPTLLSPTAGWGPAIDYDTRGFYVIVYGVNYGQPTQGVRATRFDATLGTVDGVPIDLGPAYQNRLSIAFDGTNHLVVWEGSSSPNSEVRGRLVHSTVLGLQMLGALPYTVLANFPGYPYDGPTVAFDGSAYFIAWGNGNDLVQMTRTSTALTLDQLTILDATPYDIASYSVEPGFATDGKGGVALTYSNFGGLTNIAAVRIIADDLVGGTCSDPSDCLLGFCVDGRCCGTACGGNDLTDCQACSVGAGASRDGYCSVRGATAACRPSVGPCDLPEICDGRATACPSDAVQPSGTVCRWFAGACDQAETCSGSSATCPADTFLPNTVTCRPASGVCDVAEDCSGTAAQCPNDAFATTGVCRVANGACDVAESCNGTGPNCPQDSFEVGTLCRAAAAVCDLPEFCNGAGPGCPAETYLPAGWTCRPSTSGCDPAEVCSGGSEVCPNDLNSCVDAGLPDAGSDAGGSGSDAGKSDAGNGDAGDSPPDDAGISDASVPPKIGCPLDVLAEATSSAGATLSYPPAIVEDAGTATPTVTYSQDAGTVFSLGITVVTATAEDAASNSSSCTFKVAVLDTTPPSLTCPANVLAEATSTGGAVATYPNATATDLVTPSPTVTYSVPSGTPFAMGETSVIVTAKDAADNTSTCAFRVTVRDSLAPTLSCPASMVVEATSGSGATVTYPNATVADTIGATTTYSKASGTGFPLGSTTVNVVSSDVAGNTASCSFTVLVRDSTAPTLTCPANVSEVATSMAGADATYPAATATDAVSTPTVSYTKASGSSFPVGTSIVWASATDGAGNFATCSFTVSVAESLADGGTEPDAGIDAGGTGADAGVDDGGTSADAGGSDGGGGADASVGDGGAGADAGGSDGGASSDAGDGGPGTEAGGGDGGPPGDGGAGSEPDSGSDTSADGGPPTGAGGCACRTASGTGSSTFGFGSLFFAAFLWLRGQVQPRRLPGRRVR